MIYQGGFCKFGASLQSLPPIRLYICSSSIMAYAFKKQRISLAFTIGFRLAGPTGSTCSNSCSSRDTQSRVSQTIPRQLLKIHKKKTPQPLRGNLCQCSVSHTAQKSFPVFRGNLLGSCLCPLHLVLTMGTTEKSLAPSFLQSSCIYRHWWDMLKTTLL